MGLIVKAHGDVWYISGSLMNVEVFRSTRLPAEKRYMELAEKIRIAAEVAIAEGRNPFPKATRTVRMAVDSLLKQERLTNAGYYLIREFARSMGDRVINSLSHEEVQAWVEKHFSDPLTGTWRVKPSTIRTETSVLKAMWSREYDLGNVRRPLKLTLPTLSPGRILFMTPAQAKAVMSNETNTTGRLFMFLLKTGARPREAFNLRWEDVVLRDSSGDPLVCGHVTLRSKKGKRGTVRARTLTLDEDLTHILRHTLHQPHGYVFETSEGRPRTGKNADLTLNKTWQRLKKKLGPDFKDFTVYDMRHTFASNMIQNGVPLEKLAVLMGHTRLETTRLYAHLRPVDVSGEMAKLGY